MKVRRLLVAIVSVALIAAACGDDKGGFSEEFRRSFVESCTEDQPEAFCACYVDELEERFTQEEIFRIAIEGGEEPPPEFFEAGFACVEELEG